jgi:hypothetical protein
VIMKKVMSSVKEKYDAKKKPKRQVRFKDKKKTLETTILSPISSIILRTTFFYTSGYF